MDARRWEQISAIFRGALERAPDQRKGFLDGACGGDASLRGEVSSLLTAYEGAGSFMGAPAVEAAGQMLAEGESLAEGEEFGAYRVLGPLGAGGMGTVYLAEDRRLGRPVALKVLPVELAEDLDRARRFEQEARAASLLNHPNILTVYEFGRTAEHFFIAAEYVEGRTLRQLLNASGGLDTAEALDIAAQIAGALSAAHAAGVIHRDVKPENVVVRPDGYVKVLDFGLAKLSEKRAGLSQAVGGLEGRAVLDTTPGMIVGTVRYMSPEQARGLPVDERTDVWSLGCVIYEMLGGGPAFDGPTQADVLAAVLEREPPPLDAEAPEGVKRLVARALAKDRAQRFQTMEEMASELASVRLSPTARPGRGPSNTHATRTKNGARSHSTGPVRDGAGSRTLAIEADDTNPAVEQATAVGHTDVSNGSFGRLAASRVLYVALAVLLFAAAAGATLTLRRFRQTAPAQAAATPPQTAPNVRFRRLTDLGQLYDPAVSPDGNFIAYVIRDRNKSSIWLRAINSYDETQLVPPSEAEVGGLAFSPGGEFLYYGQHHAGQRGGTVYRVPVAGGVPRAIADEVISAFGISPDGNRLAFIREDSAEVGRNLLVVHEIEGGAERVLDERSGRFYHLIYGIGPSWSPDGNRLLVPAGEWKGEGAQKGTPSTYYLEVDVADGAERQLPAPAWENIDQGIWLPDGSGVVALAQESKSSPYQIWLLDPRSGEARRVTNDLGNYGRISLTADGRQIVAAKRVVNSTLWMLPDGDWRRARQLTHGHETQDGYNGLTWTNDGRILYVSNDAGRCRLWSMDADGTDRRPLTPEEDGLIRFPSVSPIDGRVIYTSMRGGGQHVWSVSADGSDPRQLTDGPGEGNAQVTPDGRSFLYVKMNESPWSLWRQPLDGGESVKLADHVMGLPYFSPDGNRILAAYYDPDERVKSRWKLAVIPAAGGPPEKLIQLSAFRLLADWTRDGRGFYYIENGQTVSNLWRRQLGGGATAQVTDFKAERLLNFAWSRDRERLVVARGFERIDAILISDFR